MAAVRHIASFKSRLLNYGYGPEGQCVIVQNFVAMGQATAQIWRFFDLGTENGVHKNFDNLYSQE